MGRPTRLAHEWTEHQDAYMWDILHFLAESIVVPEDTKAQALSDLKELGPARSWPAVIRRAYALGIRKAAKKPKAKLSGFGHQAWTPEQLTLLGSHKGQVDEALLATLATLGPPRTMQAAIQRKAKLLVKEAWRKSAWVGVDYAKGQAPAEQGQEVREALGLMTRVADRLAGRLGTSIEAELGLMWVRGDLSKVDSKAAREALALGVKAWKEMQGG